MKYFDYWVNDWIDCLLISEGDPITCYEVVPYSGPREGEIIEVSPQDIYNQD